MKKLLILIAVIAVSGFSVQSTQAQGREYVVRKAPKRNMNDGLDKYYNRRRSKTVYVIENHRPVRRNVFIDERGRYFREVGGRREFIERHYDSYPSQYFYRDGRTRPGITISF